MSTLKVSATVHSEFTHSDVYFVMYKNCLYTIVSLSAAMIALFKDQRQLVYFQELLMY